METKEQEVKSVIIDTRAIATIKGLHGTAFEGKIFKVFKVNTYNTTVDLHCKTAVDCTCPSRKNHPGSSCVHMRAVTATIKRSKFTERNIILLKASQEPQPTALEEKVKKAEQASFSRQVPFSIPA